MPTYQYACTVCGHQLEAVQSFSDDPLTVCPECAGKLRKVFSAVGVVFKGSGFYRTDSRADSRSGNGSNGKSGSTETAAASAGARSDSSSGSNGSGKSDSSANGSDSSSGSGSAKSTAPATA